MWNVLSLALLGMMSSGPSSDRLDQIWSYAQDRMERQHDVWFDDGDFPATIQILRFEVQLSPHNYDTVTNLGWMQENIQEWGDAEQTYVRYRMLNGEDPDGPLPLADYYFRRKNYTRIPDLLEPAITRTPPPHPNAFRILAHAYEKTGKLQDAERVWKQYVAIAPGDLTAKANLSKVEKKLGGK